MKATDKKTAIESLGYEVKDFITKKNVIIKKDGVVYKCFSNIHSAYMSIVK